MVTGLTYENGHDADGPQAYRMKMSGGHFHIKSRVFSCQIQYAQLRHFSLYNAINKENFWYAIIFYTIIICKIFNNNYYILVLFYISKIFIITKLRVISWKKR